MIIKKACSLITKKGDGLITKKGASFLSNQVFHHHFTTTFLPFTM